MANPITPQEVALEKAKILPEEVINTFNKLIATNWNGSNSQFSLKDVKKELDKLLPEGYPTSYLDVEDIYRRFGWKVRYDAPAPDESYNAYFVFSSR